MQATKKEKPTHGEPRRPNVAELVKSLGSRNGVTRQRARETIVALNRPAITA